jgi:hypothetical protein
MRNTYNNSCVESSGVGITWKREYTGIASIATQEIESYSPGCTICEPSALFFLEPSRAPLSEVERHFLGVNPTRA